MSINVKNRNNEKTLSYEKISKVYNWKKAIFRLIIFLAMGYFIIGYILVLLNIFSQNNYFNISGIVGGIASVTGLLTFLSNNINKDDVEKIGVEYFKQVVKAADKLHEKEQILLDKEKQLSSKEKEIKELELKRAELEFAVQKASMIIFLKDQLSRVESRITELIDGNKELSNSIQHRQGIIKQLTDLQEEIESTEKSKIVEEVILMVNQEKVKTTTMEKNTLTITSVLEELFKSFLFK